MASNKEGQGGPNGKQSLADEMDARGADLLKHAMQGGLLAGRSAPPGNAPANRLTMLKDKGLFSKVKSRRATGSILIFSASVS